jgi:hypothetical protein
MTSRLPTPLIACGLLALISSPASLAFGQNEFQRRQEERFAAEQKRIELERMKAMSALDTLRQIELETIYIHISGAGHPERSYLHMRQYLPRALSVRQVLEKTAIDSAVVRK